MRIYLILLCALPFCAAIAEPMKSLQALRSALQAEREEAKADSSRQAKFDYSIALIPADNEVPDDPHSQPFENIEQIGRSCPSEKIKKLCADIVAEVRERMARNARTSREKEDATLRSALKRGLDATKAQDLDAALMELAKMEKELSQEAYRGRRPVSLEQLQAVEEILKSIQDGFLFKPKSRMSNMYGNPIDRILSANQSRTQLGDLIPRSELVEKLQAITERISTTQPAKMLSKAQMESQIHTWISETKRLEDMDSLLIKIEQLVAQQQELGTYNGDSGLVSQLQTYRRVYENFRDGIGTSLGFTNSYSGQSTEKLNDLKNLLVKFALPRVLGTPPDFVPTGDESVATFLQRSLQLANKTADWQLMARVLDTAVTMDVTGLTSRNDITALRDFLGGLNQERARQIENAVVSYSSALKSGSAIVPAEKIGDRLDALKKDHPTQYEAGIQMFNSPADPRMLFRRTIIDSRNNSETQRNATLTIPPAPPVQSTPKSSPESAAKETKKEEPVKTESPEKSPKSN